MALSKYKMDDGKIPMLTGIRPHIRDFTQENQSPEDSSNTHKANCNLGRPSLFGLIRDFRWGFVSFVDLLGNPKNVVCTPSVIRTCLFDCQPSAQHPQYHKKEYITEQ